MSAVNNITVMTSKLDFTDLTHKLEYYFCLIVSNTGILANIVNIVVCSRKNMNKNTMGFYNILMSIFNILTLILLGYLTIFPQSIGQTYLVYRSYYTCILIPYFNRIVSQMSAWLNVMLTFDRMLCVSYLNRFRFIQNKRILSLIVLIMFLIIAVLNISNLFYTFETNADINMNICKATALIALIRDTIGVSMRIIIPLILEVVMNTILIYKLIKAKKQVHITRPINKEYKFAFTVIVLNIIFIITVLPVAINTVLINKYGYNQTFISTTSNESAIATFSYLCSIMFSSFMYVSLLFVNLIFNRKFRQEFKRIYLEK